MGPLQEGSLGDSRVGEKTVFHSPVRLCSGVPWSGVLAGSPWRPPCAGVEQDGADQTHAPVRRDLMMFLGTTGASQLVVLCSDWLSDVRQICGQNCPFVLLSFSRTFPQTFPLVFSHISF